MRKRIIAALIATPLAVGYHYVFKDSMNLFQWLPTTSQGLYRPHLWWITKDDAPKTPFISRAYTYRAEEPWFMGDGVMLRVSHYSFSFGIGHELHEPGWYNDLDVPVDVISKDWDNGEEDTTSASGVQPDTPSGI
jgi:hypothetical protein